MVEAKIKRTQTDTFFFNEKYSNAQKRFSILSWIKEHLLRKNAVLYRMVHPIMENNSNSLTNEIYTMNENLLNSTYLGYYDYNVIIPLSHVNAYFKDQDNESLEILENYILTGKINPKKYNRVKTKTIVVREINRVYVSYAVSI